jgi:hypothetical protein
MKVLLSYYMLRALCVWGCYMVDTCIYLFCDEFLVIAM